MKCICELKPKCEIKLPVFGTTPDTSSAVQILPGKVEKILVMKGYISFT